MLSLRSAYRIPSLNVKVALAAILAVASTLACVTVNVNFPEGVVQKATDDFVRDLYRAKTTDQPSDKKPAAEQSGMNWLERLQRAILPVAHAEELFRVSTPGALAIQGKLKSRLGEVVKFKRQGLIGESSDGKLIVRPEGESKKLLAPKLKALVEAENADRGALYNEVMSANQLAEERRMMIQRSFANSFQAESPSGTWVQGADGGWAKKQ